MSREQHMRLLLDKKNPAPHAKKPKMLHAKEKQNLPSPDPPSPASTHFFQMPEMLEMTILHLPALQIFLLQRTSTLFHATITSSPPIQRKLFFKNDPHKHDPTKIESNPFLHKFGTAWFHASSRIYGNISTMNLRRHAHPTASWRNMLVSMPAAKELVVARIWPAKDWGQAAVLTASESGGGLRMGQVVDHEWEDEGGLLTLIHMELKI